MKIRCFLYVLSVFTLLMLAGTTRAWAQADGLFGSVEFRANSITAIPKWTRLLERVEKELPVFQACDDDVVNCPTPSLVAWRAFMKGRDGRPMKETIRELNLFANEWPYVTDYDNWGKSDYWATPTEFLKRSGDCEDYAILKFVSLKELGVPPENLRLVVVQDTVRDIAHAVLAVYLEGEEPLILDSLFNAVLPHDQIMQYIPHYSVNETTRWAHIMPIEGK